MESVMSGNENDHGGESKEKATLNSILHDFFHTLYKPVLSDFKLSFGDGQPFLIDGDGLLYAIFEADGLISWHPDNEESTLHIIYLMEKAIKAFIDRSGHPQLIFFQKLDRLWWHISLSKLRQDIIKHFQDNTPISTLTQFKCATDPTFVQFLKDECIIMICGVCPDPDENKRNRRLVSNSLEYLLCLQVTAYLLNNVNVCLIDDAKVSTSSIEGFYITANHADTSENQYYKIVQLMYNKLLKQLPTSQYESHFHPKAVEVKNQLVQEEFRKYEVKTDLYSSVTGIDIDKINVEIHDQIYLPFKDQFHWHYLKRRDEKQVKRNNRGDQKLASFMEKYGSSIEGHKAGNYDPIVVQSTAKSKKKNSAKQKSSKSKEIIKNNVIEKKSTELKRILENKQKDSFLIIKDLISAKADLDDKMKEMDITFDVKIEHLIKDYEDQLLHYQIKEIKDLHSQYKSEMSNGNQILIEKEILLSIRNLTEQIDLKDPSKRPKLKSIVSILFKLGYDEFTTATFGELASGDGSEKTTKKSITVFQLQHMGKELTLCKPKDRDPRVEAFVPDAWQRQLFDAIDNNQSALIIAPTSSGKTYASYYCMERVLRESDSAIVVYVAPTKALVNQVAATVYARFSKRKTSSTPLYGVFTRDFRQNPTDCQILVTVPSCLEILLLSPGNEEWARRLRYVIFDEVHNIGAKGDCSPWEHIVLMIRCPFLALSATVSNPHDLHKWFSEAETYKKNQHSKNDDWRAASSYTVNLVEYSERHADLVKHHVNSGNFDLENIHPMTLIKVSEVVRRKKIQPHISLSAKEALQLFIAMKECGLKVEYLDPSRFLGERFILRNDISMYKDAMFTLLEQQSLDVIKAVINKLPGSSTLNNYKSKTVDEFELLIHNLRDKNMLPALVFVFERLLCDGIPKRLMEGIDEKINNLKDEKSGIKKPKKKTGQSDEQRAKKSKENYGKQDYRVNVKRTTKDNDHSDSAIQFFNQCIDQRNGNFVRPNSLGNQDAKYLLSRLNECGASSEFLHCLQLGLGSHHAGLPRAMKMTTEMLFQCGFLGVVVSTTTLAQGIHMPCKTVVFYHDSEYLDTLAYHQCSGRAGRRGFDTEGNVVFFDIPPAKISHLVTSSLPAIIGNKPISLSFILRLFVYISNSNLESKGVSDNSKYATEKVLTLLENPLILQSRPTIKNQLKRFFVFSVSYLVKENYLDAMGNAILFSGLATHLHYHEPYNFVVCYLLKSGVLTDLCERTEMGDFNDQTMQYLITIVAHLFHRIPLNESYYLRNKNEFSSSKVLLEELPSKVKKCIESFQADTESYFYAYLNSIAEEAQSETGLPLSGMQYYEKSRATGILSNFVSSSISVESTRGFENNLLCNINENLFTSHIPFQGSSGKLNRYIVDFFMHGSVKNIACENLIPEGNLYHLIYDTELTIKAIVTSLKEIPDLPDDLEEIADAFDQLSYEFGEQIENAYGARRDFHRSRGVFRLHSDTCHACKLLVVGNKVTSPWNKPYTVRGSLTCETSHIIFGIKCVSCKVIYIMASLQNVSVAIDPFINNEGLGASCVRHHFQEDHKIEILLLQEFTSEKDKERIIIEWKSKLQASNY